MKLHFKKALAVLVSAVMIITSFLLPGTASAATSKGSKNYVNGEVIAVLADDADTSYTKTAYAKTNFGNGYSVKNSFTFGSGKDKLRAVVLKSKSLSTAQMLKQLRNNGAVVSVFPNYKKHISTITDDTYSNYQWALDNQGQNGGTAALDTNADALWEKAAASEKEQVVAVVDTGIDYENEDLKDIVWNNPYGKKLLGKHGMDFTGTIKGGEPMDDNGHGSHCAGIIAAQADNQTGISGINKSNVKIMALKFLDAEGSGTTEDAIAAYEYLERAVKLGTNVVACNNSWGGGGDEAEMMMFDEIYDRLGKLGVINFVAAGNSSMELGAYDEFWEETYIETPACCTSSYCITVGASNESDELADFSNYSKDYVDVAAPGTDILSTVSYNCFNPTLYTTEQKAALCGTQMQDYETTVSESDFGYLKKLDITDDSFINGTGYETATATGFGTDGSALQLKLTDEIDKKKDVLYAFEVPFTLKDETKPYSISMIVKGNNEYTGFVFDVPQSMGIQDIMNNGMSVIDLWGCAKDNFWDHYFADMDPEDKEYEEVYTKDTNRKLVFIFVQGKKDTTITIDDLAISNQDADPADFGKYDFYNGTSMATPYATGAAALIKNAQPDATAADIINIIKNAGRHSDALEGKVETAKVLSLDDITKVPPMISGAAYNEDGNVEITGSFVNTTSIKVNGEEVTPIKEEKNLIVIPDNHYNTKKAVIEVTNNIDTATYNALLSSKPGFKEVKMESSPVTFGSYALPAGNKAYFVSMEGIIGAAMKDEYDGKYSYSELTGIDTTGIFDENVTFTVNGAVYRNDAIYMNLLGYVNSQNGRTLGYETALVKVDLNEFKTKKIAEIPDDSIFGSSLAVYNGEILLIGGNNEETFECSKNVYKLDEKKGVFTKQAAELPEGRASAKFLQYKDKLIGMYGMNDEGTFPSMLIFDGKEWKTAHTDLESDDAYLSLPLSETKTISYYIGNLGYDKNGIFANGAYIYGIGDTFTYDVANDKITASKYAAKNTFSDASLVGTTVPGGFIGFKEEFFSDGGEVSVGALAHMKGVAYDDIDGENWNEEEFYTETAYVLDLKNTYPTVDTFSVTNGYIDGAYNYYYNYGDLVPLKFKPEAGYAATAIKVNGKTLSTNANSANLIVNEPKNEVTVSAKLVASPITSLKVTKTTATTYTLSWNKAKKGTGYEVQEYKNKKWTTVKTIKNLNTTTYKVTAKAGTTKYRVRAYGTFNKKTVYGASKSKEIYVPKKQTIKSVSGASKAFTVKYTKDSKATGYEIQYAKKSDFKSAKTVTVTKNKTVSKKVKDLDKGKYYVRVRSYKTVDGKKVYGAYSAAKTVTVKK